jgi:hypothetical protein
MTADSLTEKPKKKKKKTAETAEEKEIQAAEIEQKLEAGVEVNEIDAEVLLLDSEEISKYHFNVVGFYAVVMSSKKFCHYL